MLIKYIILFIFVFALLQLNIPQINQDDHIKFKIYIFFGVFLFDLFVDILSKYYNKKIIDTLQITKNSIYSGLVAVVAYSIYNDLSQRKSPLVEKMDTPIKKNVLVSGLIVSGIGINHLIARVFQNLSPTINDQLNFGSQISPSDESSRLNTIYSEKSNNLVNAK